MKHSGWARGGILARSQGREVLSLNRKIFTFGTIPCSLKSQGVGYTQISPGPTAERQVLCTLTVAW